MYTSLFKSNNVRVTQKFKGVDVHGGVDLVCDDTLYAKVYLPSFFGGGEVWKITRGYSYGGKWYADGRIIWVKHTNGYGQRFIHSREQDIVVKVGQKIKVGDHICSQGATGPATGVHLHYDIMTKYDDTKSRIDPLSYINNETMNTYNIGDKIKITSTDKLNIRTTPNTTAQVVSQALPNAVGSILSDGINSDGYLWQFVKFFDVCGWIVTKWSEKTEQNITTSDSKNVVDQMAILESTLTQRELEVSALRDEVEKYAEQLTEKTAELEATKIEYSKLRTDFDIIKTNLRVCQASKVESAEQYSLTELLKAIIEKLYRIITGTIKE